MTQRRKSADSCGLDHAQLLESAFEFRLDGCPYVLTAFQPPDAAFLLKWVKSPADLRWLAPNTSWPLTEGKIREWTDTGGHAFVLRSPPARETLGYGEVNTFKGRSREAWIGHVIIEPGKRGRGLGTALVRGLLQNAFVSRKASRVSLIVFPQNVSAVHCYLRAGFRVAGTEHHRTADSRELLNLTRLEMTSNEYKSIYGVDEMDG